MQSLKQSYTWLLLLCLVATANSGCRNFYFHRAGWAHAMEKLGPIPADTTLRLEALLWPTPVEQAPELLRHWAELPLGNWPQNDKVSEPRIMLARLLAHPAASPANDTVQVYIRSLVPYAKPGSTWLLRKKGDYDFAEITLAYLLAAKELDTLLAYETRAHLARTLIIEKSHKTTTRSPGVLAFMQDTENHVLMRDGSRHLRLQWEASQPGAPAAATAAYEKHAKAFGAILHEMRVAGAFEYNADPYMGYTLSALLVIHHCSNHPEIVQLAQEILDTHLQVYLAGVFENKYVGPFRRRFERARKLNLAAHPGLAMLAVWQARRWGTELDTNRTNVARHQALMAAVCRYQPPDSLLAQLDSPRLGSYTLGHGPKAAPGQYTHGGSWLLAGGGAYRGRIAQSVPQPIVLLTQHTSPNLRDYVHLPLPSKGLRVNHTGIWQHVAIGPRPPHIPPTAERLDSLGAWLLLRLPGENPVFAAVHRPKKLGAIVVAQTDRPIRSWFQALAEANPKLGSKGRLRLPEGQKLVYDTGSCRSRWAIWPSDTQRNARKFDRWPQWQFTPLGLD